MSQNSEQASGSQEFLFRVKFKQNMEKEMGLTSKYVICSSLTVECRSSAGSMGSVVAKC